MFSPPETRLRSVPLLLMVMLAAAAAALSIPRPADGQSASAEDALVRKAKAIHEHVIALDTHNDIDPANFTADRNYTQRLDTQVNLPKMIEGGLDASFFIVYVGQPNEAQNPDSLTEAG